jgi:2-(1,2-epoxy-1,2-dihydrophenyl)acetyl-CoA isomerase
MSDVRITPLGDHVSLVELCRPPDNYMSVPFIGQIADALEACQADGDTRAVVLAAQGKHFCAGAKLDPAERAAPGAGPSVHLYDHAVRIFATELPIVAAVQGAAIGGGLGVALSADFRVACPEARFSANFARLGFHHGFGTTVSLPAVVGQQRALELLYTGRRIDGEEALRIGLVDRLVPAESLRDEAIAFARDIAASGPLALRAIRATMRGHLAAAVKAATDHEKAEQDRLGRTADFAEGVRAMGERRPPSFTGR